jgi:alkylation response protein AidB-like acyl-CoA dehydrogenase
MSVRPVSLDNADSVTCAATPGEQTWSVTGVKTQIMDADLADEFIVVARDEYGPALLALEASAPGIRHEPCGGGDGTRRLWAIRMQQAAARHIASGEDALTAITRMRIRALLAVAHESLGLAERMLADAVSYARAREQFGRAIGAFQAISVPLADCYVEIATARALTQWAVTAVEIGDRHATVASETAKTQCAEAAVHTAEVASQVFGAIAFTWEHHLHRYLRRALFNEQFEIAPREHRRRLAQTLIDEADVPLTIELMDDMIAAAFRTEVRAWIADRMPTEARGAELIADADAFERVKAAWQLEMAQSGKLVAHWPVEWGGRGTGPLATAIFRGEAIRAHPRVSHGDGGEDLVAPLILKYGTTEQKARYLEPIREESEIWAQGFSEPEAGSDLAALKTRAVKRGNVWVLNGQKTWTTYAPHADWLFVLARTDPDARRHRGITCFIVPVDAPGVEVRTIIDSAGTDEFGEVFFTDTEVPDDCVLGGLNDGWSVAITTLAFERVIESCEDIGELEFAFDRLLDGLRDFVVAGGPRSIDGGVRDTVARLWCGLQAVKLVQHGSLRALEAGQTPPPESEILKLAWSVLAQQVARLGVDVFASGLELDRARGVAQWWETYYLVSRSMTLYAGTSEILRSVIAERILGLPRSR